MERIYHNFKTWEDHQFGMYETTCFMDQQTLVSECESLLKCPPWLQECMVFVALNWTHAAEQFLTNTLRNRQAWLGQAACCFMHGAPEYVTKIAWGLLSPEEQKAANEVADYVIKIFEDNLEARIKWEKNTSKKMY